LQMRAVGSLVVGVQTHYGPGSTRSGVRDWINRGVAKMLNIADSDNCGVMSLIPGQMAEEVLNRRVQKPLLRTAESWMNLWEQVPDNSRRSTGERPM